jgi:hypothetical protein
LSIFDKIKKTKKSKKVKQFERLTEVELESDKKYPAFKDPPRIKNTRILDVLPLILPILSDVIFFF